jgi:hypothetical protein
MVFYVLDMDEWLKEVVRRENMRRKPPSLVQRLKRF